MNTIYKTIKTEGLSATALLEKLEKRSVTVSTWAKEVIGISKFKPTKKQYDLVAIRGDEFTDEKRTTKNIYAEADKRGYGISPIELALYLRRIEQSDLGHPYVAVMHEPICGSHGCPGVLGLDRSVGGEWLGAWGAYPGDRWSREDLFVFLAPQVSSKKLGSGTSEPLPFDFSTVEVKIGGEVYKLVKKERS